MVMLATLMRTFNGVRHYKTFRANRCLLKKVNVRTLVRLFMAYGFTKPAQHTYGNTGKTIQWRAATQNRHSIMLYLKKVIMRKEIIFGGL
jgi:hypothetical protein